PSARAQAPQWEIFGGFDYLDARACISTSGCKVPISPTQSISLSQSAYGWHASLGENKTSWFGGVADFSGDYANRTVNFGTTAAPLNVRFNASAYPFLFGPRFYWRRDRLSIFGNPLIGGVHARANVSGGTVPVSETKWAFALGGGADFRLSDRIAIRGQFDWIRSHFPETFDRDFQNNLRAAAG